MECVISQRVVGPNDGHGSPVIPLYRMKPHNISYQHDDFDMSLLNCPSPTTVDHGPQYTPEMEFSTIQGQMEFPMGYMYPGHPSGWRIQEPRSPCWNARSMAPLPSPQWFCGLEMSAIQVQDWGTSHLMSEYEIPPGYMDVPRMLLDQTDRERPVMDGSCDSTNPTPVSREVMSRLTTGAGNSTIQYINWVEGSRLSNPQLPYNWSGLKPHAPPSGLGNEYVYHKLGCARNADLKLLLDHQAKGFNNHLAHRPKPNTRITDIENSLNWNQAHLERRKSVPHRRLRKRSSVDHQAIQSGFTQARSQLAGTQVFDANMKIQPSRKKRRFSEGEKGRIARVRKAGACGECRVKKRRV